MQSAANYLWGDADVKPPLYRLSYQTCYPLLRRERVRIEGCFSEHLPYHAASNIAPGRRHRGVRSPSDDFSTHHRCEGSGERGSVKFPPVKPWGDHHQTSSSLSSLANSPPCARSACQMRDHCLCRSHRRSSEPALLCLRMVRLSRRSSVLRRHAQHTSGIGRNPGGALFPHHDRRPPSAGADYIQDLPAPSGPSPPRYCYRGGYRHLLRS